MNASQQNFMSPPEHDYGLDTDIPTLVARLTAQEKGPATSFILSICKDLPHIGATEESAKGVKDAISILINDRHRQALEVITESLGVDHALLKPDARQELGVGEFSRQEDIECLGVICFIAEFLNLDALSAQTLISQQNLKGYDLISFRGNVEAAIRNICEKSDSVWGSILERVANGTRNSFEKALIRGFLDVYVDLQAEPKPTGLARIRQLFSPHQKSETTLAQAIDNPNLEITEEAFLAALVKAHKLNKEVETQEAQAQKRQELELIHAEIEAKQVEVKLEQAKLEAAQAQNSAVQAALELHRLRAGMVPASNVTLPKIPEIIKVSIDSCEAGGIEYCKIGYGVNEGCYYAKVTELKLTYTEIEKFKTRDQNYSYTKPEEFKARQEAWKQRLEKVSAKALFLTIPNDLAFQIQSLDASDPLRKALKTEKGQWVLCFEKREYTDLLEDGGWGKLGIHCKAGSINENLRGGYDIKDHRHKETALENIILNLVVQAIEMAEGEIVPRIP